jgi:hypothetical protein
VRRIMIINGQWISITDGRFAHNKVFRSDAPLYITGTERFELQSI